MATIRPSLPASKFVFVNPNGASTSGLYGRYGARSIADLVRAAGDGDGISGRTSRTVGGIRTRRRSYAGAPTSTSRSGFWATRTSPPRRGTCTCPTRIWPRPSTRRSRRT